MSSFTKAAYKILKDEGKPLTAEEIFHRAVDKGLLTTRGKTPYATMWASLYLENIRKMKRGERLRFRQYKDKIWGLAEWDK